MFGTQSESQINSTESQNQHISKVSKILTVSFQGVASSLVEVQVQIVKGLPAFNIVGLANKAVMESKERIKSALHAIGLALPPKRIVVNMSPADLQKEGNHYDLPIILGILSSLNMIPQDFLDDCIAIGEISLDGKINQVNGTCLAAICASKHNKTLVCPATCAGEAKWKHLLDKNPNIIKQNHQIDSELKDIEQCNVVAAEHLLQLINHIRGIQSCPDAEISEINSIQDEKDFKDVKGHESIKRAMVIAAAGKHNLLMIGPPGAGKSMLASRITSILPPLTAMEALEISMIYSMSNLKNKNNLVTKRPFRNPHHSASTVSMVGGGNKCKPGEISLSHHGVLFMDELSLWKPEILNSLREPIETGNISVARANHNVQYPAQFQLIAAMNPCICGNAYSIEKRCNKFPVCYTNYINKIPGPILDRFDIVLLIDKLSPWEMSDCDSNPTNSHDMQNLVLNAVSTQSIRNQNDMSNGLDKKRDLIQEANVCKEAIDTLNTVAKSKNMSMRSYCNVVKVARTIADIDQKLSVECEHMEEAISYNMSTDLTNKDLIQISS